MKTFILNKSKKGYRSNNITIVDFEKHEVSSSRDIRIGGAGIDEVYVADEPMEVRYQMDNRTIVKKADKGDIIIVFYDENILGFSPVVVVKNAEWKKNIALLNAEEAARKSKDEVLASTCERCSD